jgi:hypothetical protein
MPAEQDTPRASETDAEPEQQQPSTAQLERYDEAVADKIEGIDGASAAGPAA